MSCPNRENPAHELPDRMPRRQESGLRSPYASGTGDCLHCGLLVEFQSFVDAVRCAIGWQCGMAERHR